MTLENRGSNVFGDGWENNLLNQFVSSISEHRKRLQVG